METKPLGFLSVVMPARDEEACIGSTIEHLYRELCLRKVPHEIIVVDDGSVDRTWEVIQATKKRVPVLTAIKSMPPHDLVAR